MFLREKYRYEGGNGVFMAVKRKHKKLAVFLTFLTKKTEPMLNNMLSPIFEKNIDGLILKYGHRNTKIDCLIKW